MDAEGLRRGEVHVWWFHADAASAEDHAVLDAQERAAAARLRRGEDGRRFVARRATRRRILAAYLGADPSALRFDTTCVRCGKAHGKPRLVEPARPIRFNASHADGIGLIAVAHGREVGADLESPRRVADVEAVSARFFSPAERAALETADRTAAFLRAWCAKEAYLKLRGLGLAAPLERVDTAAWSEGEWLSDPLEDGAFALARPQVAAGAVAAAVAVERLPMGEPFPTLSVAQWNGGSSAG